MKLCIRSWIVALVAVRMTVALATGQNTVNPLQATIDAAAPGDVISVPAGTYAGPLVLKEDIALVGDGADVTIIDGNGAAAVISGAKNAMLVGCTIRNGRVAIVNREVCMGVFECRINGCQTAAIEIYQGCAVVANNLIEGNQTNTGILCTLSNPYVSDNVIVSNGVGVSVADHSYPSLVRNIFVGNRIAVLVGGASAAYLGSNVFDRNATPVVGQALGATDALHPVTLDGKVPVQGGALSGYRALMEIALRAKLSEHPVVIYDLRKELGSFGMTTLFPWATFTVAASAGDTHIAAYEAFDAVTASNLCAQLQQGLPAVAVINPALQDVKAERYALSCVFQHPASYFAGENGQRVFRRLTNVTRVEIILPTGYKALSVNFPATVAEGAEGNQVVKITEVGPKQIEVVMAPSAP